MRTVNVCPFNGYSVYRRLNDDVLFSVQPPAQLMTLTGRDTHLLTQTSCCEAVLHISRSAVIACGKNMLVFDGDGPDFSARTGGTLGNQPGNIHKILGPGYS